MTSAMGGNFQTQHEGNTNERNIYQESWTSLKFKTSALERQRQEIQRVSRDWGKWSALLVLYILGSLTRVPS